MPPEQFWEVLRSFVSRSFPGDVVEEIIIKLRNQRTIRMPVPLMPPVPAPSPRACDRDILDLLADSDERLTAEEIKRRLLNERQQLHGDSTIEHALARLMRSGQIDNERGRGYGLISK